MITINQANNVLNSVSLATEEAIEKLIEDELNYMGFAQCVIIILDSEHNPVFRYHRGFTQHQLDTYVKYMNHDIYMNSYFKEGKFGKLQYLQELIPSKNINNEIFCDILVPALKIEHSMAGLHTLTYQHMFFFSSYTARKPTVKQQMQLYEFWQFMIHWANSWVTHKELDQQWQKLSSYRQKAKLNQSLTPSERAVLSLLIQGLDGSEIARHRNVSKETVRSQIKQLLKKTGSKHQNQLLSRFFYGQLDIL
ncbi:LuxR family transcriptional regulator [Vibrio albus]|uniref:LuxR family transcriptional regulator n=1 Tax=Vibrio albus TaxID=2200953 RepID=A0A2U3B746_9VIBR|nr:helix-turn-helix transcriptional regulator [Vibrio albus]PWI32610.1 LuxR family transcriptional regulator [Vibrio albus]